MSSSAFQKAFTSFRGSQSQSKTPQSLFDAYPVRLLLVMALLTLVVISGCSEARVPVFPVTGKVTFQGKPPVGAQVVLHPVSGAEPTGIAPTGFVKDDGSFAITAYEPGDGAPQGDYVATIQWFKIVTEGQGGGGRGPNVLPAKYANAKTSPVKVTVGGGPTEISPISITN